MCILLYICNLQIDIQIYIQRKLNKFILYVMKYLFRIVFILNVYLYIIQEKNFVFIEIVELINENDSKILQKM